MPAVGAVGMRSGMRSRGGIGTEPRTTTMLRKRSSTSAAASGFTAASPAININPGGSVTWTYQAKIDSPAIAGSSFTNTANAKTTSIDGSDANERTASSSTNTGYSANSSSTVKLGGSSVTKSVDPSWVTIGTPMTYKATVTIPKSLNFFNLTVTDVLPDSIDFDGYVGSSCIRTCWSEYLVRNTFELTVSRSSMNEPL